MSSDKTIRELIADTAYYGSDYRKLVVDECDVTATVEEAVRRAVDMRGSINPHWKSKTNAEIVAAVMGDNDAK